jgi:hypothetical protein
MSEGLVVPASYKTSVLLKSGKSLGSEIVIYGF